MIPPPRYTRPLTSIGNQSLILIMTRAAKESYSIHN